MKTCKQCAVNLIIGENICNSHFNNSDYVCKSCRKIIKREWVLKNEEHILKYNRTYREENINYFREWDKKNRKKKIKPKSESFENLELKTKQKDYDKIRTKIYREKNKEILRIKNKEYQDKIKKERLINLEFNDEWLLNKRDYFNQYHKKRKLNDPLYKLSINIRSLIGSSFKRACDGTYIKGEKTENILGCSISDLINHLKFLFLNGMSFENYGEWEIDHIIPISSAKDENEIYLLNHYTNLQPLWKIDNIKKGNKIW